VWIALPVTAAGDDCAALGTGLGRDPGRGRSVVGSLWQIADEAAQRMVVDFYRNIAAAGSSRAESSRQA